MAGATWTVEELTIVLIKDRDVMNLLYVSEDWKTQ